MGFFDNGWKGNVLEGLAIGIGASILAPIVLPIVAGVAKPLAKGIIKSGILFYEKGREAIAEATEVVEDIIAEVKVEMEEGHAEAVNVPPEGVTNA